MRFDPNLPPHSVEAEQAVLGGLMLAPEAWPLVSDTLSAEDFYRHDHQLIFESIRTLAEKQRPFDAVTIGEWFESRGKLELVGDGTYITELASTTPSAANVAAYAEIVVQYAGRRRLADVGRKAVESARQQDGREFPELLAELTQDIAGLQPAQRGGLRLAGETMIGWWKRWQDRYHSGTALTGLESPWAEFNRVTHGLQPSTAYLIAGRPSMGKSIAALNLAVFNALRGVTVGMFSLEMSIDDCHNRNVASVGRIPHDWVAELLSGKDRARAEVVGTLERLDGRRRALQGFFDAVGRKNQSRLEELARTSGDVVVEGRTPAEVDSDGEVIKDARIVRITLPPIASIAVCKPSYVAPMADDLRKLRKLYDDADALIESGAQKGRRELSAGLSRTDSSVSAAEDAVRAIDTFLSCDLTGACFLVSDWKDRCLVGKIALDRLGLEGDPKAWIQRIEAGLRRKYNVTKIVVGVSR